MAISYANSSSTTSLNNPYDQFLLSGGAAANTSSQPEFMWDWNGKLYATSASGQAPKSLGETLDQLKAVANPNYTAPSPVTGTDGKPVEGALNIASGFFNNFKNLSPEQQANINKLD